MFFSPFSNISREIYLIFSFWFLDCCWRYYRWSLFYLFLHVCVWVEKRRAIDMLVMEPNTHGACCAPYFLGFFFISASQFSRHQLRWYYNNLRGSSCGERRKNKVFIFFRWWCVIKHSVMSHKSCDPPTLNTRRTHHHHQGQMVKRVAVALFFYLTPKVMAVSTEITERGSTVAGSI